MVNLVGKILRQRPSFRWLDIGLFVVAETKEECRELELVLLAAVGGTSSKW